MAARAAKLTRPAGVALVLALLLAAAGAAESVHAVTRFGAARAGGEEKIAHRIVSLVPSLTETLFAIGAGPSVVGVDSFASFPPEVARLPRVGALIDPDVERILSLRPDLVIAYGSQTSIEAQLSRAGIRIYSFRHGGIAGAIESIRDVGRLSGHQREAGALAMRLSAQLEAVRARVRNRPRPRTLLVIDRQPGTLREIYVSGGVGFLHEVLDAAGGENVFADARSESVQPSIETLLTRGPEAIVEVRAEGLIEPTAQQRERTVWNALQSVPAVRTGKIYFLSGSQFVVPGPRLGMAAEALARALHPAAFR